MTTSEGGSSCNEQQAGCPPRPAPAALPALRGALLFGALATAASSLQGCQLDIPRHNIGNWRKKENYFKEFSYNIAGGPSGVNSCSDDSLAPSLQCSGHGRCEPWFPRPEHRKFDEHVSPTYCFCDPAWADPECSTQRKSQLTALLLSMSLGPLGADQFYLGWYGLGVFKLLTLGGCGVWWVFDVVRIGSSPVATSDSFRVAPDVEHWAFVLLLLSFVGLLSFGLAVWSIHRQRVQKAKELLVLNLEGGGAPMGYGAAGQTFPPWQQPCQPPEAGFRGYSTTLGGGGAVSQRNPYATGAP